MHLPLEQILEEPSSAPLPTLFQEPGTQTEPNPRPALGPSDAECELRSLLTVDSEACVIDYRSPALQQQLLGLDPRSQSPLSSPPFLSLHSRSRVCRTRSAPALPASGTFGMKPRSSPWCSWGDRMSLPLSSTCPPGAPRPVLGSGFQMFFRSNNVSLKSHVGCSSEGQMGPGAVQWVRVLAE